MISNPGKRLNRILSLIILLAIALMPFGGAGSPSAQAAELLETEVTVAKDQSDCGACYAFAAIGNTEYNTSSASNNPPQLSSPAVEPPSGTTATSFCYYVNYYDSDGDSPSLNQAFIDGIAYTMLLQSGSLSNGVYRCVPGNLSVASHEYYFYFEDGKGGTARLPPWSGGSYSGPEVSQENSPPNTPSNPSPANHATGVSMDAELSWTGGDPDAGDTVTYDVYLGASSPLTLVSQGQPGTTYDPLFLPYNIKHYWQIVATDNDDAETVGPLWDFTTALPGQADIALSPPGFEVTLPQDTTQDYTLNIGNTGNATLSYGISDREMTGGTSTAGVENPVPKQAGMVPEVPSRSQVLEPDRAAEPQGGWQDIMTDGFEGAFPGVWDAESSKGHTDAYWGKDSYEPHSGLYSAFCAKSGSAAVNPPASYPNNMEAWMVYGPFALCDAGDAELNFYYWLDTQSEHDCLYWKASINGTDFYGSGWSGHSGGWVSESFDLTHVYALGNLCGRCQVWIACVFESDGDIAGQGAFIDDIVLRKYVPPPDNPPNTPSEPSPANHATDVSIDADLSWTGGDPDAGDTVTYDVYFGTTGSVTRVAIEQPESTYDPGTLYSNTTYYWKIIARDSHGEATIGPLWDFTTSGVPGDNPPDSPSNPSPPNHATGISINDDLSWTGGDPDPGDTVTYDVYFGSSATPPLVSNDQPATTYDPGTLAYNTQYYWRVVAWDSYDVPTTGPLWDFTTASEDCLWLDENPKSGTVEPGNSDSITVTMDATGLADGNYSAEIVIANNDPDEDPQIVPVTLHVTPPGANNPPDMPSSPSPADHAAGVSIDADLSWTGGDPDAGDTVTYDVYFGSSATPLLASDDQAGTGYDPGVLSYNTTYYWKVVATDSQEAQTTGPLWDFTTGAGPSLAWEFTSTSGVFIGPAADNGRPYLDAAVSLPTGTEPEELSGVYWLDEQTGEWQYFIPALGSGTLTSLEPGQAYLLAVSGPCTWNLLCGEGTPLPAGSSWNFLSHSDSCLAPTPDNGRPYLNTSVPLPTGTEPPELSGVYWLDEATGDWQYYIPALGGGTLTSLEPGQAYLVAVSGPCSWSLP